MSYLKAVVAALWLFLAGCSTVNCTINGDGNKVTIEQPKTVQTSPSVTTGDNTVPASLMP